MKQMFLLSKKDLELSKEEVLRLYDVKKFDFVDDLLIIETEKDYSSSLAYTKEVYEFLFECKPKDLENVIKDYDWQSIYKTSFSLSIINNKSLDKKNLAGIIWEKLKNPKVDLKYPKTKIVLFSVNKKIICGKLKAVADKSYLRRKAHLRPELHPTSLDPQLARACVNLTGKNRGKLLDPFCGSGGILIEAGLLEFEVFGFDIDRIMINRSKINLAHFRIKSYSLKIADATKLTRKFDCIVTDLPYGKASKVTEELESLYMKFLESAYKVTDSAVVIFPSFVDYKTLLSKWIVVKEFSYYLHKSLSKKIVLLEKRHNKKI